MKRAWTLAKESDVIWQQEDQSEKQFPFHAHLLQFCLSSLHCILHFCIRAIKSKIVKWRPPLNFKYKGMDTGSCQNFDQLWHILPKERRVWCWHFIENSAERKDQKPSLGWKVMNCWRGPVDKKSTDAQCEQNMFYLEKKLRPGWKMSFFANTHHTIKLQPYWNMEFLRTKHYARSWKLFLITFWASSKQENGNFLNELLEQWMERKYIKIKLLYNVK